MRGSYLLPQSFRNLANTDSTVYKKVTHGLLAVSKLSIASPIPTIVVTALLASSSYVGLLQDSLFDNGVDNSANQGQLDVASVLRGSRTLELSEKTSWKWQILEDGSVPQTQEGVAHQALTTFWFPDSSSAQLAPEYITTPSNLTTTRVPFTANLLSPISQDTYLAYYTPFDQVEDLLNAVQQLPANHQQGGQQKTWIMQAAQSSGSGSGSYRAWLTNGWTTFLDLVKHAETLDIVIMALGYLSMYLTFISLFVSMKRLGSNAWLATSVIFNSVFSFLFGLFVTTKLGVSINMVLLSEGLPFLVVTIGFEKAIILTRAVLSASYDTKRRTENDHSARGTQISTFTPEAPASIEDAVDIAVRETGFEIVRDYAIEIGILVLGAASGVQGGLRQFCFLAAWILFFDCVLLFTFYTTILCIKLEINKIKRQIALRKALEEDGINRRVAENVASSNDWSGSGKDRGTGFNIFGQKIQANSIPKFKVWMVTGFILINAVNLLSIPFQASNANRSSSISSVLTQSTIDPFKVAENGLDAIYVNAKSQMVETYVTVVPPIKYDLNFHNDGQLGSKDDFGFYDYEYSAQFYNVIGGRMIVSILKSLEDPILSKWVLIALTISIIFNGYLFNAARWNLKDSQSVPSTPLPTETEPWSGSKGKNAGPASKILLVEDVEPKEAPEQPDNERTVEEVEQMLKDKKAAFLTDEELIDLGLRGKIPGYAIEKTLEEPSLMTRLESQVRAVKVRRAIVARTPATKESSGRLEVSKAPYKHYNYELVHGACCENVIGYLPLPLGVAGPMIIDGKSYYIPMATTEGVLVASTSRGAKAINAGGGCFTVLTGDGMTRGPCIGFPSLARAGEAKVWIDSEAGQKVMKDAFNSTSRFARLQSMKCALAGTYLYVRFKTMTGDAMGMNMISKGTEKALHVMATEGGFDDMQTIAVSGNYCTDKKPAAINWIDGRGKSVVAEAIIPADVVRKVLKTDVDTLVELNISKNLIGSAMAGSIGGFNAHASNIVTAIFLATGQDPAQNVESSNCITIMKNNNGNLQISVSMPSIEVGTIGGGTILEAQSSMLDLLGVKGAHPTTPGANARQLARIVAAGVLAGELSLCGALAAGHLVRAHMAHNRSAAPTAAPTRVATPVSSAVPPALTMAVAQSTSTDAS